MSIKTVLKETARSFASNIFINILLMIQFAVCFYLLLTVVTYHFQIGDNEVKNFIGTFNDKKWYMVRVENSLNNTMPAGELDGLSRLQGFYNELNHNDLFQHISFRDGQSIYISDEIMDGHFGVSNYDDCIDRGPGMSIEQCHQMIPDGDSKYPAYSIKSVQMDLPTYNLLGLHVMEGEGLTEQNTQINSEDSFVPIVLGYAYRGYFHVGETFRAEYYGWDQTGSGYNVKVVGILQKNSCIPSYGSSKDLVYLDYQVLFPTGLSMNYIPKDRELRSGYAQGQYTENLSYSYISLNKGVSYQSAITYVHSLSEKYGVFDLGFTATSFGMDLLRKESQTTIDMITILSFALFAFTLFFLFSSCISRIQKNTRTYAVYLMNGADVKELAAAFLLEMFILFIPAVVINYIVLQHIMMLSQNYAPFLFIVATAILIFLITSVLVIVKLRGVKTEELMRRKD